MTLKRLDQRISKTIGRTRSGEPVEISTEFLIMLNDLFNGKRTTSIGTVVSGVNGAQDTADTNTASIVALDAAYQAADGVVTTAYISADAVVTAAADSAIASLSTTLAAAYQADDAAITTAYISADSTVASDAASALASESSSLTAAYEADDAAITTAYISADAVVTAAADSANASLSTTLTAAYESADDAVTSAYISADSTVASNAASALASESSSLTAAYEGADTTLQSNINTEASTRASADTATAASVTTLEAFVAGPSPNLMPNSNFELGEEGWTTTYGAATYNVNGAYWYASGLPSGTTVLGYGPGFDVVSSGSYSFSYEQSPTLTGSAQLRCDLECYDSEGGTLLGRVGLAASIAGGWTRIKSEGITLEASTTWVRLRWYMDDGDSGNASRIRRAKVERNATATAYSMGADTHVRGAKVVVLAEANIGSDGKALAKWSVTAAAGGNPARLELLDGDDGSSISLDADQLFLGPNAEFETTDNTFIIEENSKRNRFGSSFGASGDLLEWFGPTSVGQGSETKTNGYFAKGTDGKVYYGTAELGGSLLVTRSTAQVTGGTNFPGNATTGAITVTATGGAGSYVYDWDSLDAGVLPNSATSATTTFTRAVTNGGSDVYTVYCDVSDADGTTIRCTATARFTDTT